MQDAMHLSTSFWTPYCNLKFGVRSVYALVWSVGLAISIHSLVLFLIVHSLIEGESVCSYREQIV